MSLNADELRTRLSAARAEALRVHDSPVRADRLGDQLKALSDAMETADVPEERRTRVAAALQDAMRVLRRDEDGREAARHLQTAMSQVEGGAPRHPSPFLDD